MNYLEALDKLAFSRPGFEWANYAGYPAAYRADYRTALTHLHDYRALRIAAAHLPDETIADAAEGTRIAFIARRNGEGVEADYTTGQYYPTEYRAACCRVLASALWYAQRTSMIAPTGDSLRASFRNRFGAAIQRRWFN